MTPFITFLFCLVEDWVKTLEAEKKEYCVKHNIKLKKTTQSPQLSISEILTIILNFYDSHMTDFKNDYLFFQAQHRSEFSNRPTYARFNALMKQIPPFLVLFLKNLCKAESSSEGLIDSTPLRICYNKGFLCHIAAALVAYKLSEKRPCISFENESI